MSTSIACLEILTVLAESCDQSRLQRWYEIYNEIFVAVVIRYRMRQ